MGLFSRKSRAPSAATLERSVQSFIGRKFRSDCSLDECLSNFIAVSDECYPVVSGLVDVGWRVPTDLGGFISTQGSVPAVAPARVVARKLATGGHLYLALWNGMASYGNGTGDGGPPCEMWFVPPGFEVMTPIAIAGTWKRRDSSLSSIGNVESPLWGVSE